MKSSLRIFLIPVLLFFSISSFAQANPDDLVKKFFDEYQTSPVQAINDIYLTNSWTLRAKDAVDQMKNEVNKYTVDYMGKYYGYVLITQKKLSDDFILYSYMIKYDRQPLRFTFKLYKPNDKWMLFSLKIDGNLDDEIEESAKLVYLNLDKN